MLRGLETAALVTAMTFSGMGGIPTPTKAETELPQPVVRTDSNTRLGSENPKLTFNQEAYLPTEEDALRISSITQIFLDAGANPDFAQLMNDRFIDDFENYFAIHKAPESFGFQYNPFGKDNPVRIDFYANEELVTDSNGENFSYLTNTLNIIVGDDGTLFSPRGEVELFPLEMLPEMVEANLVMDGLEEVSWKSDIADPSRQFVLKEVNTPLSTYVAAGDTMGNIFLGTESLTPLPPEG